MGLRTFLLAMAGVILVGISPLLIGSGGDTNLDGLQYSVPPILRQAFARGDAAQTANTKPRVIEASEAEQLALGFAAMLGQADTTTVQSTLLSNRDIVDLQIGGDPEHPVWSVTTSGEFHPSTPPSGVPDALTYHAVTIYVDGISGTYLGETMREA